MTASEQAPQAEAELRVRTAAPSDYETFARLVGELQTGDPVPERTRWEAGMAPTMLLFEDDGAVVAYAYYVVLGDMGYVRHVVVDPAHRGRRHGRVVMEALAETFRAAGCSRWCLNVKPENTPAVRLYRSVGMTQAYPSTALRLAWDTVASLPAPARAVTARVVDPAEDAALEAAFDLPKATLTSSRRFPGRAVLALADAAAPSDRRVGVASFDPHHPGAFPFRVAEASLARALLEAIRPYKLEHHTDVGVVAEDHPELARMLVAHGAKVLFEMVHFRGTL